MTSNHSNTEKKQPKKRGNIQNLIPFEKGKQGVDEQIDKRINRKGRPKSFDQLRALFQDIAGETIELTQGGKKLKITRAQAIGMAMSMDKKHMREFLEFAYGKPPQKIEGNGDDGEVLIRIVRENKNGNAS